MQILERFDIVLDAAATRASRIAPAYLGPDHPDPAWRNALAFPHWADFAEGGDVWLNPPYSPTSLLSDFLTIARATAAHGSRVIALLPVSTGSNWWWEHVVDGGGVVEFLRGRLSFRGPHAGTAPASPMWDSALVIWQPPRVRTASEL